MRDLHHSFLSLTFLKSVWGYDYEAFKNSSEEAALEERLIRWAARADLKETSAEAALIEEFFRQTWGYIQSGQQTTGETWTSYPQYPVRGAGQKGGMGEADLAMGYFLGNGKGQVPQVLCEFKDIKSALDAPQKGRKDGLSPVKQCLNYLSNAKRDIAPGEPVTPHWGIVTDMNEFRLYWHDRGTQQFIRFVIRRSDLFSIGLVNGDSSIPQNEDARFERFLFWKVFHKDTLIIPSGKPQLVQMIEQQWVKERKLEQDFYEEYRALREQLYLTLLENNPAFPGTKGRLVRLAQKILDRCIFIFFCEDMGAALKFPPQLFRDFLIERSRDTYFDPKGDNIWTDLVRLFKAMNKGSAFGPHTINQFNGGLFADDEELETLIIPNMVFCQSGQGANEASLFAHKQTLLYLSASYNYAGGWAEGLTKPPVGDAAKDKSDQVKADPEQSLGLYTLGRIFEQSITELEILEAEADGRLSVNELSKRKRDGVYYTPEWIVERIVQETLGPILDRLKRECQWPKDKNPTQRQIEAYLDKLGKIKIVDPACGSGAFLITTLRYLLDEFKIAQELRRSIAATGTIKSSTDDELVRDILKSNIYGVDINAASVEIARLALWLHTARGDKPLSSLEGTIKEGNSLINSDFYKGQIDLDFYSDEERERVNVFDWDKAFPEVFERGGFDAVVGNPPYVKLQNFRKVHADMAKFLKDGREEVDEVNGYASAKTGNFDLYLPFIEKGLALLNENGRLGYIAPSVWVMNKYGAGLRKLISRGKQLHRWLDFKSHQIFDEATVYTSLQFYSKSENKNVEIAYAPDGSVSEEPWADPACQLSYKRLNFDDRWLLVTGPERSLIDKLTRSCRRLDSKSVTTNIFVGLQTSADEIYHLKRIGTNRYLHTPKGKNAPPPYEVIIEEELMKPLVSGVDAKRYEVPDGDTCILFPYQNDGDRVSLIPIDTMKSSYPDAWKYLINFKARLKRREATLDGGGDFELNEFGHPTDAPFNDEEWYRYGRHQALGNQEKKKLIVAQTVPSMRVCADFEANLYLNNVRVNGVLTVGADLSFLLGVLNSKTVDWVFKRIAKPKDGGWFEANRQFIAPLPIPKVTPDEYEEVSKRATELHDTHTTLRNISKLLAKRTSEMPSKVHPLVFLFPDIVIAKHRIDTAPATLETKEKRDWAKQKYDQELNNRYMGINNRLDGNVELRATLDYGELKFLIDEVPVIDKVFVSEDEAALILAQWKAVASTFNSTGKEPGKKLCSLLRKLVVTTNEAQINQIIKLQEQLGELEISIDVQEREMNQLTYELYDLTPEEVSMVERG